MNPILQAALDYAARGWPVVPIAGKRPWLKDWVNLASVDAATVRGWWEQRPKSGVGLLTGPRAGHWVLDVDPRHGGLETLADLEREHGELVTLRVRTGSGGLHLYFRHPVGLQLTNRVEALPGLDVRGAGGQVVAPPSLHPDTGLAYEWENELPIADAPRWLLDLLRPPSREAKPYTPPVAREEGSREERFVSAGLVLACQDVATAPPGARHRVLYEKAVKFGGYVATGLIDEATVAAELQRAGEAAGKDAREVGRTVRDGLAAGMARPLVPELGESTVPAPPDRAEVMAWWGKNPEMSSREVAQVWGVPAGTLRRWAMDARTITPPVHSEQPPVHAPVHPIAPPVHGEQATTVSPVRGVIAPPATDHLPITHPEREGVHPLARLEQLAQAIPQLARAEQSSALLELLDDRGFVDAMAAARADDPLAGVALLARIAGQVHGGKTVVKELDAAIKVRRKALVEEARTAARARAPVTFELDHPEPDLPELRVGTDMSATIGEAIRRLAERTELPIYQRGGMLVHLTRDASPVLARWDRGAPALRVVRETRLQELLAQSARWTQSKLTDEGWQVKPCLPPRWAVQGVMQREEWPLRRALGVTEIPILRDDGSVHEEPGYDPQSGYVYAPPDGLRLEWPTGRPLDRDLAYEAYQHLCAPLVDFPFEAEHHRAAAVSAILSLVARPAILGPCPMFPILSTTPKSGKTILVEDVLYPIATGRDIARMQPGDDDAEMEKRITTVLVEAHTAVLLDNLTGTFGGGAFDAVVQGRMWRGRMLGRTESVEVPARAVWFCTGNNLSIRGDLAQRVIPVQLAPQEEHPEHRTGFKIPELRTWVKERRPLLLAAAYVLLRAHAAAGRPQFGIPFGGYADWDRVVRSALVWAGAPDPYAGVAPFAEAADERHGRSAALLELWYGAFRDEPIFLADLPQRFSSGRHGELCTFLKEFGKTGELDMHRVGLQLRNQAGRIYDGLRLERCSEKRHGARAWRVCRVAGAPPPPPPEPPGQLDIPY